jgi:hypothetical protein
MKNDNIQENNNNNENMYSKPHQIYKDEAIAQKRKLEDFCMSNSRCDDRNNHQDKNYNNNNNNDDNNNHNRTNECHNDYNTKDAFIRDDNSIRKFDIDDDTFITKKARINGDFNDNNEIEDINLIISSINDITWIENTIYQNDQLFSKYTEDLVRTINKDKLNEIDPIIDEVSTKINDGDAIKLDYIIPHASRQQNSEIEEMVIVKLVNEDIQSSANLDIQVSVNPNIQVSLHPDIQIPVRTDIRESVNTDTGVLSSPSRSKIVECKENRSHSELLTSCRVHRNGVLRASTSSAGGGSMTPKNMQQLTLSACTILIQIGDIHISTVGTESDTTTFDASQPSQFSQNENKNENSIESILLQNHALLALALHKAPDELISSICDSLFTKMDNSKHSGNDIHSITTVVFLSGVLLVRIRTLVTPASRLLLRYFDSLTDDFCGGLNFVTPLVVIFFSNHHHHHHHH